MGLSNAERQKRHRDRVKAKLASPTRHNDALVDELREAAERLIREENRNLSPGDPEFTMYDAVLEITRWKERETFGPILSKMLNLPGDPWPGLSGDHVKRMIKGRRRSLSDPWLKSVAEMGPAELPFRVKAEIVRHRKWLEESGVTVTARGGSGKTSPTPEPEQSIEERAAGGEPTIRYVLTTPVT